MTLNYFGDLELGQFKVMQGKSWWW